jgi:hypothetical protein
MDIVRYTNKFFAIERELDLFSDRVDGNSWWDAVRYDVYHLVYYHVAGLHQPLPAIPVHKRVIGYVARKALRASLYVKILFRKYDVVVFRCPRHQERGKSIDLVIDPVMAATQGRMLVINTYPFYYHRRIRRHEGAQIKRPPLLNALTRAIEREFTTPPGLEDLVLDRIGSFTNSIDEYMRLFRLIAPRLVLMVQNGVEKGMFCAARSLGVPVIEVQHGLIQYVHAAYSYPPDLSYADLTSFPDHFFAFSQYWIDSCCYPALHHAIVGNDNYFVEQKPSQGDDVLFVSGCVYDKVLRAWIKEVAARLPQRGFKYKLHPNQRDQEAEIRADLSLPNIEVIGPLTKVRDLLPSTSVVVVIQSTVAHEALQAGKTLCILPLFDYQTHTDLFVLPQVFITPSEDELVQAIAAPRSQAAAAVFFNRFDHAKTRQLMIDILKGVKADGSTVAHQNAVHAGTEH